MFHTVLIAGRGEIACRIIATLRRLGIRAVAVYSDPDAGALHVRLADVARRIGPAAAARSYLDVDAVIAAARATGAQAIHPGYGFLSENAGFARACERAGIVFVGPSPEAIETMGDKIAAKAAVTRRGVPTVPGVARHGMTDADLVAAAPAIGYPLLVKPAAGGGGKGMHVVEHGEQLAAALATARREAAASFDDDGLFLERYLPAARHIEVQVLADAHGRVVHLGERECSLQRRHQKVVEEAPSPLLDDATRAAIGEAACQTARSVGYRGAGTVEFIVSADRPEEFFFMEMNTRLQVEHPVTEQITGIDLVEQQLRIAAGEPLALAQEDVVPNGHSIEARVYAEDPAAGFLPTGGHVDLVVHPEGPGIRVDTALASGLDVSTDYDPMLAKIVAWGADREQARRRLVRSLGDTVVFGFPVNVEFLRLLLEHPDVAAGRLDTGLISRHLDDLAVATPDERLFAEAALLLDVVAAGASRTGPWRRADGWRLGEPAPRRYPLRAGEHAAVVWISGTADACRVRVDDGAELAVAVVDRGDHMFTIEVGPESRTTVSLVGRERVAIARAGAAFEIALDRPVRDVATAATGAPHLEAPMPGTVVLVRVADGAHVEAGDALIVVEAMKMEHVLTASVSGTVSLRVAQGDAVARGQTLAVITPPDADADADASEEEQA